MIASSPIHRTFFPALLGAAIASYAAAARSDEPSVAARLFEEGRALMIEGRFADACPKLAESQRLEPRGGTQLNLAVCDERQGKIATAWAELHDALITARTDGGHPDREKLALERIAVIEPRLPWLTLRLTEGDGARDVAVQVDGATVAPTALGKEMPVDPGERRVSATAGGRVVWERTVTIAESERATITVSISTGPSAPPPPDPSSSPPPAPMSEAVAKAPPWKGRWVFEVGAFGGGLWGNLSAISSQRVNESVLLRRLSGPGPEEGTCARLPCSYATLPERAPIFGIHGFVGYAERRNLHLGVRLSTAVTTGGGTLATLGPSVSAQVVGPLWLGGSLLVGVAFGSERANVSHDRNYEIIGGPPTSVPAWTGPSPGASLDLGVSLFDRPGGSLIAEASPLFFASPLGYAFALPVGLAYRWH